MIDVTERAGGLHALVVDDEAPSRDELAYLLRSDQRVASVRSVASAAEALKLLGEGPSDRPVDVVFCDIRMPGLDGMELARVVARFANRPRIVFVTAYDDHAVDAFELEAVDYVMKPVRPARMAEAVRRVLAAGSAPQTPEDETIPVDLAGVTRFVRRSQVRYVEAQGDYVRLHTAAGGHLVRTPLAVLEERWADAGFVRVHRSTLVCLAHVDEVRSLDGHLTLRVGDIELPVSRRHMREVRDRLALR